MMKQFVLIAIVGITASVGIDSAQAQQGYAQPPQGYAQPPQGYAQPPQGYAQPPQGYAQRGVPYTPPVSMRQSTSGYGVAQPSDWKRFYHYPYVYYPHSFKKQEQFNNMYHRYPQSMQIPVYNKSWYNFYPTEKPYHDGHHFLLDIF